MRDVRQWLVFSALKNRFPVVYKDLKALGDEPFVLPFWASVNAEIEKAFLPVPPIDFLNLPSIKSTMFVEPTDAWRDAEVGFLKQKLGYDLQSVVREDLIGKPKQMVAGDVETSANTVHHAYHIFRFLGETGGTLDDYQTVVEWGGGYGNFAKLWWRTKQGDGTFVMIDSALFATIQWLYLSSVLGTANVHLLQEAGDEIITGKINIVPLALLKDTMIDGDLFVSTWGLSESAKEAQDFVRAKNWFNCEHLLVGFQNSTEELYNASRLGELAKQDGARIIDIEFIPNNHYAIK